MNDLPDTAASRATEGRPNDFTVVSLYQEPALLRYVQLLWKHRLLILVGSVLPALLIALLLYLGPRKYTATLVYERALSEREYSVLQRRFHSRENLDKIIGQLNAQGLGRYVRRLEQAQTEPSFERLIRFVASPMYPRRLQTTDPCTSEKISGFQARLLFITVTGRSEEEVAGASGVVSANLENVLPLYDIRNALKESIQKLKSDTAEIEDQRFTLTLDLEKEKAKLEKFQALSSAPTQGVEGGVVLQFTDVEESQEFLPLSYQMHAVQSKIIDLQETLRSDAEKYNYYLQVLDLNNQLLAKVESSLLMDFTVPQFLAFVTEQLPACKNEAVADYLKSYLRKTENLVLVHTRAGERPVVYPAATHLVRSSVLTFVLGLMVAAFVAVLRECRSERHPLPGAPGR
jgi:hypothetical protein